ncbi:Cas10/Cmr2 second palm domain-containing protein [Microtetraspora glauca]|uniref:Cas10/Cmr2 second palm domain-containing protein n=1 Tax=Microtetraspora glauca TaxID=1996 RepID=A0ABV3GHH6_MICGL
MYVVVIGTAGNQRYIFSSRKRQEIVGASDLIAQVNGSWADEAMARVFPGFDRSWRIKDGHAAELITAGAGAITVLVRDKDAGRSLVTELTGRALREAPGLDVCGVVVEAVGPLAHDISAARTELAAVRESRPGPQARFLRLPLVEDCASTGLPAMSLHREGRDEPSRTRSAASMAKLDHFQHALSRLAEDAQTDVATTRKIVDRLGLEADWVAVVHADGNGFGDIFRGLGDRLDVADAVNRDGKYTEALRTLSLGVDDCAKRAFHKALTRTAAEHASVTVNGMPPVLPLVLGGDDLTVLCEGAVALPFARHYLEAFEEETASDALLRPILDKADRPWLGAAAGVAIVKRNYPFRFAYDLAEELITAEAKQVKAWGSALAFTVLFESSAPDLARIRSSSTLAGGTVASASPYLVGRGSDDPRAERRRWSDLLRRVDALQRTDAESGELLIPSGAVHELREGLCLGAEVADARFTLLRTRFSGSPARLAALAELEGDPGRLVWRDHSDHAAHADHADHGDLVNHIDRSDHIDRGGHEERMVTGLMDAVAALPFLPIRGAAG